MDNLARHLLVGAEWGEDALPAPQSPPALRGVRPAVSTTLSDAQPRRKWVLEGMVEREVIPRLLLAHRPPTAPSPATVSGREEPSSADVTEMTALLIGDDMPGAVSCAERILERGVSVEMLFVGVLARAAQRLEELWSDDRCDWLTVTLGEWRLGQILRRFVPGFRSGAEQTRPHRRALLATPPGEPSSFATTLTAEFFRRAGWFVSSSPLRSGADLVGLVRSQWFSMIGLSVASEARLTALAAAIRAVRRASINPTIGVMVLGSSFIEHPELVRLVGAHTTAADAGQAPLKAEALVCLLAARG